MIGLFFLWLSFFSICTVEINAVDINIGASDHQKMKLCIVPSDTREVREVAQQIQHDLMWSNQFIVDQKNEKPLTTKRALKKLSQAGYPLVIIISKTDRAIDWRLYDTNRAKMLSGKRVAYGTVAPWLAHHCADGIWEALTGTKGCFSSKIAFCKEKRFVGNHRPQKYIYVSDFDGNNMRSLVTTPTVNMAPRWNRATANEPLIYYSECTVRNVRLVVVDMDGRRRTISDFDGLNMLVCWSPDGTRAVLCLSRSGSTQLYLYKKNEERGKRMEQITFKGMNISSCFIDNDRIAFCSDNNKQHRPYICVMNLNTHVITDLVHGYCSSPNYSQKRDKIAFAKLIDRELQLCTYDMKTNKEVQLTIDKGSKDECCWSPCGNYLVYALQEGNESQIAVLNVTTRFSRTITLTSERCSYPAWSPLYENVALIN